MSERTLRDQIAGLPRYEPDYCDRMGNRSDMIEEPEGDWIMRDDALAALDAHTAAQTAPDAVAEADLTEEQRAEIVDAAHLAFHRSQRGIQGQVITEWHGIESHVVVETQRYLRNLAKGHQQ